MPSKAYLSFSASTTELCLDSTRDTESQQTIAMLNPVYSTYIGHPETDIKFVSGWKIQTTTKILRQ